MGSHKLKYSHVNSIEYRNALEYKTKTVNHAQVWFKIINLQPKNSIQKKVLK